MVVNKAINKLKEGPDQDKQMVAIGGAGLVVLLLVVAWGYIFIKRLQNERLIKPQAIYEAEQQQFSNSPASLLNEVPVENTKGTNSRTEFGSSPEAQ